jgi:predicted TIM-barrel fold metal-dependent hydrolase
LLRISSLSIIMLRMIVDFHTHVVPPGIKERRDEYLGRDACFSLLYAEPEAKLATAEEVTASMDEHGIDKSVILNLGWVSHELCVETNDYILEAIARYPERLIGFCAIQPEPVGHQYFGKGTITPEVIYPFIASFPDLKIVCAHWGGGLPFYALMPEVDKALSNVYFDTAATPFLYKPQIFKQVADIVGSDRILFGSDYPLLSPKRIIDQIESTGLSQKDKAKILGGNAKRLLSIR